MLCAARKGGLDLLNSFNISKITSTFFGIQLPFMVWIIILSWQFSGELPTPARAGGMSAFKGTRSLGDGETQLKVCAGRLLAKRRPID